MEQERSKNLPYSCAEAVPSLSSASILHILKTGKLCHLDPCRVMNAESGCICFIAANRIERLSAALKEIDEIDVLPKTEKYPEDIGHCAAIARKALLET